jgi:hypothetical protein
VSSLIQPHVDPHIADHRGSDRHHYPRHQSEAQHRRHDQAADECGAETDHLDREHAVDRPSRGVASTVEPLPKSIRIVGGSQPAAEDDGLGHQRADDPNPERGLHVGAQFHRRLAERLDGRQGPLDAVVVSQDPETDQGENQRRKDQDQA